MKNWAKRNATFSVPWLVMVVLALLGCQQPEEPRSYSPLVNPLWGLAVSPGFVGAGLPDGHVRLGPAHLLPAESYTYQHGRPYHYGVAVGLDVAAPRWKGLLVTAFAGPLQAGVEDLASRFSNEQASLRGYSLSLDRWPIDMALTANQQVGAVRYFFGEGKGALRMLPQLDDGRYDTVTVSQDTTGTLGLAFRNSTTGDELYMAVQTMPRGKQAGVAADAWRVRYFHQLTDSLVELRFAQSVRSLEEATNTLLSQQDKRFGRLATASEESWNQHLDRLRVLQGDSANQRLFYSALHRALSQVKAHGPLQRTAVSSGPLLDLLLTFYPDLAPRFARWSWQLLSPQLRQAPASALRARLDSSLEIFEDSLWLLPYAVEPDSMAWSRDELIAFHLNHRFSADPAGAPVGATGQLAPWTVFAMLGVMPFGDTYYALAAPVFEQVRVRSDIAQTVLQRDSLAPAVGQVDHLFAGDTLRLPTAMPRLAGRYEKVYGMLLGAAIGDALGGPFEFQDPPFRSYAARSYLPLTAADKVALRDSLRLRPYGPRWRAAPYGVWHDQAPAGATTDDTRWMLLVLQQALHHGDSLTAHHLKEAWGRYPETVKRGFRGLAEAWQEEVNRVLHHSVPTERLWHGLPTVMGQMALKPVAALHAGHPEMAYRHAWQLAWFDNGTALDLNAALTAGLAEALAEGATWATVTATMRHVDPFGFHQVPWVPRRVDYWLNWTEQLVERHERAPAPVFKAIAAQLSPETWWETHVPLVIMHACMLLADHDPLVALQLSVEFGQDTDSYAQLVGAFMGALHGKELFAEDLRRPVEDYVYRYHGVSLQQAAEELAKP